MGKALSPHLWTEFWFRRWPWWYFYISRLCFANWNADMCRNSLIVILCFCNIILGLADLFFFPSSTVNTVSAVSYIIRWHQREQSYICQLGRNHPLTANLWQVVFFYYFHLGWWSIHSSERDTMGSPSLVTMLCLMELLLLQSWREGTGDLQVNPFLWVVGTYPQSWLPVSMGNGGLTGLKVIASFILIKFNGLCNERLQLME